MLALRPTHAFADSEVCANVGSSGTAIGEALSRANNTAELLGKPHFDMAKVTRSDMVDFIAAVVLDCTLHPETTIRDAVRAEFSSAILAGKSYVAW